MVSNLTFPLCIGPRRPTRVGVQVPGSNSDPIRMLLCVTPLAPPWINLRQCVHDAIGQRSQDRTAGNIAVVRVYGELRFEKRAMERDKFIGIVNNQRSIHSGLTPAFTGGSRAQRENRPSGTPCYMRMRADLNVHS